MKVAQCVLGRSSLSEQAGAFWVSHPELRRKKELLKIHMYFPNGIV